MEIYKNRFLVAVFLVRGVFSCVRHQCWILERHCRKFSDFTYFIVLCLVCLFRAEYVQGPVVSLRCLQDGLSLLSLENGVGHNAVGWALSVAADPVRAGGGPGSA